MSRFYEDMFKGNQMKELVKVLLEKSGYLVFPYGYESTLSDVRKKLNVRDAKNSRTVRRIKSTPDLLVYDGERKDVMLVEVKMRRAPEETNVVLYPQEKLAKITNYKEFWNDLNLVLVVPSGNMFYAQRISGLETKVMYNASKDFEKFEDFFTRVKAENLSFYRNEAQKIMQK